jgi:hypothetical protein
LHLEFHCELTVAAPPGDYLWVLPNLPRRRLAQVAAICDAIASANVPDQIPYSFGPPNDCFDEQSCRFLLGPTKTGLTCASFVLAVFHRAGIPLVRPESWPPPTQEDIAWQKKAVKWLKRKQEINPSAVSDEHIRCVESEVGNAVRYRPEHVAAAAAMAKSAPSPFKCVSQLSHVILAMVRGESLTPHMRWRERLNRMMCVWWGGLRAPWWR